MGLFSSVLSSIHQMYTIVSSNAELFQINFKASLIVLDELMSDSQGVTKCLGPYYISTVKLQSKLLSAYMPVK